MDNDIIVEFPSGNREVLPADIPVYVESWADYYGARADAWCAPLVDDLVPAGTLGSPDSIVNGRALDPAAPFLYYVADADGWAEPIEIVVEGDALATVLDVMGGEWGADEWGADELIRLAVVVDTLSASRLCIEVEAAILASAEAYADDLAFKGDELDGVLKDAPYKEKGEALRALSAAVGMDSDIAMCSVAHTYLDALEAACKD